MLHCRNNIGWWGHQTDRIFLPGGVSARRLSCWQGAPPTGKSAQSEDLEYTQVKYTRYYLNLCFTSYVPVGSPGGDPASPLLASVGHWRSRDRRCQCLNFNLTALVSSPACENLKCAPYYLNLCFTFTYLLHKKCLLPCQVCVLSK